MTKSAKKETTKDKILRISMKMFLEKGYTPSSVKMVCDELGISKGNYTFYFQSKDIVLAELIDRLCSFQWQLMKREAEDGVSALLAICFELMSMAAAAEEDEAARDFFVSAYQSNVCLEIIQKNDTERAKEVFAEYCPDWTDEQFRAAENIVSGIEYSTLNTVDETISFEARISTAIYAILSVYQVPEEIRQMKIQKVLAMDYRAVGRRILKEFKEYVEMQSV